jgi:UDP-glucose 4-epimerase
MNVLITGSSGFIGTNLVALMGSAPGFEPVVWDSAKNPNHDLTIPALRCVGKDVEAIVHLAAWPGVVQCFRNPDMACDVNVSGTVAVLRLAQERDLRLVFASSQAARVPLTIYGATKRAAESLVTAYAQECGVDAVSLRFSNVYGPHSLYKTSIIPTWCKDYLKNAEVEIHGSGEQRRNFIYVRDVCRAILRALEQEQWHGEVYDVIGKKDLSINELYRVFCDVVGASVDTIQMPQRDNNEYRPDEFDILPMWEPRTNFYTGLEATWECFKKQHKEGLL